MGLRILLLAPQSPPPGGIATWTKNYVGEMHNRDAVVSLINTAMIGNRRQDPQAKPRLLEEAVRTWVILSALIKHLVVRQHDLAHVTIAGGTPGLIRDLFILLLLRLARVPIISHFHYNIPDQVSTYVGRLLIGMLCNCSNAVVVLTHASAQFTVPYIGSRCCVVPNFVAEVANGGRNISSIISEIVFVGHVCCSKGVGEIIAAAKMLPAVNFTLIGPISAEFIGVTFPANINCTGEMTRSEINDKLQAADLFLFPSYTEGFSMALLEAMAAGLPVVATAVGAIPEMVDIVGARLVDVGNIDQIVRAIKSFDSLESRSLASRANVERVRKCYMSDVVIGEMMRLYQSVLSAQIGGEVR